MEKKKYLKKVYEAKKPVNIRDILTDKKWEITLAEYNDKTGKYEFQATHEDGRKIEIKRNRQYVDKLIQELLDAKRKEQ